MINIEFEKGKVKIDEPKNSTLIIILIGLVIGYIAYSLHGEPNGITRAVKQGKEVAKELIEAR